MVYTSKKSEEPGFALPEGKANPGSPELLLEVYHLEDLGGLCPMGI